MYVVKKKVFLVVFILLVVYFEYFTQIGRMRVQCARDSYCEHHIAPCSHFSQTRYSVTASYEPFPPHQGF